MHTFNIISLLFPFAKVLAYLPPHGIRTLGRDQLSRHLSYGSPNSLVVDLGYEIYEGYANSTTNLNVWKGIRYAAPPTGQQRWQPPQTPVLNRTSVRQANEFPPRCPQSGDAPYKGDPCEIPPNANTLPLSCLNSDYFQQTIKGSEDCLFLNVYSPQNATDLPVLVWIHGGGYGSGNGSQDLSAIINANQNGFVGVAIQYRLGAFGFLSSDEIFRFGTVNAGLLDQHFALHWVQIYIGLFGGDPLKVTISGESAGGGSVMLQDLAYGGTQGPSLFRNIIAASPYLPMQYGYGDWIPSQSYYSFAHKVGCFNGVPHGNTTSIFNCLLGKDSYILQQASAITSATGQYGTWGFLPVTDGRFIQQLPSQQMLRKQVNSLRVLTGNNADEGPLFTPQNIVTEQDFVDFVRATFPLFSADDISRVLLYYPSPNSTVDPSAPLFSTEGNSGPTALNQSDFGTGQQQRADNLYAETTFVCPSYWMAGAHAQLPQQASFKYQFSVPPAYHGEDLYGFFGPLLPMISPDFQKAFMNMFGNFIMNNDPSIPNLVANGISTGNSSTNPASSWPQYSSANPYQMNLNETGGQPSSIQVIPGVSSPDMVEPGLKNDINLVNAFTWEGGRGTRCDFWLAMGLIVPE